MQEFYKRHKTAIIISLFFILIFPVAINFIVIFPLCDPNLIASSKHNVWVNFFAVYSSTLISAFVSFVILYKTIENNKNENLANRLDDKKENEINRNLQISILKYQVAKDEFNAIKSSLAKFRQSLNFMVLSFFPYSSNTIIERQKNLHMIEQIIIEEESSFYLLMNNLNEYKDEYEMKINSEIQKFNFEYHNFLQDLAWIVDKPKLEESNHIKFDDIKNEAEKYKEFMESQKPIVKSFWRIWDIVEHYNFNIIEHKSKIIEDLYNSFDIKSFDKQIEDFMKYEKAKIECLIVP